MEKEVRIFIAGDEFELKPLFAHEMLSVRSEGAKLHLQYGGGEAEKALITGACMLAASLRDRNGETVFGSGSEALAALTAEEIMSAVSEYGLNFEETKIAAPPDAEREQGRIEAEKSGADVSPKTGSGGKGGDKIDTEIRGGRKNLWTEDASPPAKDRDVFEAPEKRLVFSELKKEQARAEKAGETYEFRDGAAVYGGDFHERGDMKYFSDFFERESRRFDRGFERY